MASSFLSLPREIRELCYNSMVLSPDQTPRVVPKPLPKDTPVVNFKVPAAWLRPSQTSRKLHLELIPLITSRIIFSNNPNTAESALQTVKKYGNNCREVVFIGCLLSAFQAGFRPGEKFYVFREQSDRKVLCSAGEELLLGFYTPNATVVTTCWAFDFNEPDTEIGHDTHKRPHSLFRLDIRDVEEIEWEENRTAWRLLLKNVLLAVSRNKYVRQFRQMNIQPALSMIYRATEWHSFIGRLESLTLYFGDNLQLDVVNSELHQCIRYMDDLGKNFLFNATNLKSLCVSAFEDEFSTVRAASHLAVASLPKLEKLVMHGISFDSSILGFLTRHGSMLKHITLSSCWVFGYADQEDWPMTWTDIFEVFLSHGSMLEHFSLTPADESCYSNRPLNEGCIMDGD